MSRQQKQEDFIKSIAPYAQEVQRKYGVPASIAIAQAALETGWGDNVKGNNLYGIKSGGWDGAKIEMATHEFINGKSVGITDSFRAYAGVKESIDNYGKFLAQNDRYSDVIGNDANGAANALQRAGYATDPKYAAKLKDIIAGNDLTRFDDATYKGYTASDEEFTKTRKKLQQERVEHPEVWDSFMGQFMRLIMSIFSGLGNLLGGAQTASANQNTIERPQTPDHKVAAAHAPQQHPRG